MKRPRRMTGRFFRAVLASVWAIPAVLAYSNAAFAQANFFGWHTNLNTAAKVSTATGKPIFLVFRCVR